MVRRYMRAYTEAIHYYKTHKEETMKIMRKYSRLDDRKVLEEAWDWHARFIPGSALSAARGLSARFAGHGGDEPQGSPSKC